MALSVQVGLQRIDVPRQAIGLAIVVVAIKALDCITRLNLLRRTWATIDTATTATTTAVAPAAWLTWRARTILTLPWRLIVVARTFGRELCTFRRVHAAVSLTTLRPTGLRLAATTLTTPALGSLVLADTLHHFLARSLGSSGHHLAAGRLS